MHRTKLILIAAAVATALAPAAPAFADPGKGRGNGHPVFGDGGKGRHGDRDLGEAAAGAALGAAVAAVISPQERDTILRYFRQYPVSTAGLPPGIAKNVARGKPLPPGIAKKALPGPLLADLADRDGAEFLRVGATVVLVAVATGLILDALDLE